MAEQEASQPDGDEAGLARVYAVNSQLGDEAELTTTFSTLLEVQEIQGAGGEDDATVPRGVEDDELLRSFTPATASVLVETEAREPEPVDDIGPAPSPEEREILREELKICSKISNAAIQGIEARWANSFHRSSGWRS